MQLPTIEFLKQFRTEETGLPLEQRPCRNVSVRYFGSSRKERRFLGKLLEENTANAELIGVLVGKMEKEDQVVHRRLRDFIRGLLKNLTTLSRKEPYSAQYLTRLSAELRRFIELVEGYQDKMQLLLLDTIKSIAEEDPDGNQDYVGSKEIRYLQIPVRQYLDIIYYYHDTFTDLLQEELGRTGTSAVISPVEAALFKLTTLIKSQIFSLETTDRRLYEWKKSLRTMETQGIYN